DAVHRQGRRQQQQGAGDAEDPDEDGGQCLVHQRCPLGRMRERAMVARIPTMEARKTTSRTMDEDTAMPSIVTMATDEEEIRSETTDREHRARAGSTRQRPQQ